MTTSLNKVNWVDHVGQAIKAKDIDLSGNLDVAGTIVSTGPAGVDGGTATLSSNAATLSQYAGQITTESLTTAAGASQALTLTIAGIATTDLAFAQLAGGSSSAGTPILSAVCTANTLTITVLNKHASAALNGTLIINYLVNRP